MAVSVSGMSTAARLVSRMLSGEPRAPRTGLRMLQHGIALVAKAWQVPSLPDGWRG